MIQVDDEIATTTCQQVTGRKMFYYIRGVVKFAIPR
jgi:hypothetical protein